MRRKRTPKWATVQRVLAEATKITFRIVRHPMLPDRYTEVTYEAEGVEQHVHRATAPNLRKALQASPSRWYVCVSADLDSGEETFIYLPFTPPTQAGAPAAPPLD